jgi:hypothetical protein
MKWLLWRQHRLQATVAASALLLFAIALWLTGVHMANLYHDALNTCRATDTCDSLNLFQGYGAIVDIVNLSVVVPLLLGLFWGATLVGREYDTGTNALVWTQSVSKRHWLTSKVVLLVVGAVIWSAAVTTLVTWWSGTTNSLYQDRFDPSKFDVQGVVPIAYSLFAVGLGLAAGAVLRRILPALAVTLVGFAAVRIVVANYLRPHYQAALVANVPFGKPAAAPGGSWMLKENLMLNGHIISGPVQLTGQCDGATDQRQCLGSLGYRFAVTYQPANRYWTFQFIESGLFVVLAAIVITVAVIVIRRRDA